MKITGATFRAGTPTKADHEAHAVTTTDGTRISAWLLRGRTVVAITLDGERWALQTRQPGHGEPLEGQMWTPDGDDLWCPADPATMTPIAWATKADPSPVMLCERNSREVAGWRCKRCGAIYGASWYRIALACCAPRMCDWRDGCAEDAEPGTMYCPTHLPQMQAAAELASFQSARKITASAYQGWVFSEVDPDRAGEGYYDSADELLQHCRSKGIEPPNYAWACNELRASSDADTVIEDALTASTNRFFDMLAAFKEPTDSRTTWPSLTPSVRYEPEPRATV